MDSQRNRSSDHKLSFVCPRKRQPRRTVGSRLRAVMSGQNPANHILIYSCSESQVDLIGDLRTSPGRIPLFHLDDCADEFLRRALRTGFGSPLRRKQQPILSLNQGAMKAEQRRWFEGDRDFTEPTRLDPKGTEAGNQAIPDAEIGGTSTRTVQDQQLMFDQNGFGDDRSYTSGLASRKTVVMRWTMRMNKSRMDSSYLTEKTPNFALNWNSPATGSIRSGTAEGK